MINQNKFYVNHDTYQKWHKIRLRPSSGSLTPVSGNRPASVDDVEAPWGPCRTAEAGRRRPKALGDTEDRWFRTESGEKILRY